MNQTKKIALALHGGAGTILKSSLTAELENKYRSGLKTALEIGWLILQNGGTALDAVEETVCQLEDNPLFNAGRGAVFTHDGANEMDASVMDGATLKAGAVAFVRNVKNPIRLARLVMEKTEHVLLAGSGANEFAREMKVALEPDEYFYTDFRFEQLQNARRKHQILLDHTVDEAGIITETLEEKKFGTVGAVALDVFGNVAAATSTGGMTNKKYGRVGDTPIVGAGTYADNRTCAVSCTGHGEFFMVSSAAYDVAARMKYKNLSLIEAADETVEYLRSIGGEGGLIAVDASGNLVLPFNSDGMYRAYINSDGETSVDIH
jgi:beta-aspartyl-peptidase (threonine type)